MIIVILTIYQKCDLNTYILKIKTDQSINGFNFEPFCILKFKIIFVFK